MKYELYHHGILGMKWGIRRYQNEDGSLTPAGRRRLAKNAARVSKTERELSRAKWYDLDKARRKRDKALDKYEDFVDRLNYSTMSDDEIIKAVKNFKSNASVSSVVTSRNVNNGKSTLDAAAETFSKLGTIGNGITQIMGAASATKKFIGSFEKKGNPKTEEPHKKAGSNRKDKTLPKEEKSETIRTASQVKNPPKKEKQGATKSRSVIRDTDWDVDTIYSRWVPPKNKKSTSLTNSLLSNSTSMVPYSEVKSWYDETSNSTSMVPYSEVKSWYDEKKR